MECQCVCNSPWGDRCILCPAVKACSCTVRPRRPASGWLDDGATLQTLRVGAVVGDLKGVGNCALSLRSDGAVHGQPCARQQFQSLSDRVRPSHVACTGPCGLRLCGHRTQQCEHIFLHNVLNILSTERREARCFGNNTFQTKPDSSTTRRCPRHNTALNQRE